MTTKVGFLGMGGTIAGTALCVSDNVGYTAAQLPVAQLLCGIPGVHIALNGCELLYLQVAQVDSKDLEFSHWVLLARAVVELLEMADVRGVVITHGTDTLEETAYFLSKVLPISLTGSKPVILTCAMRPASSIGSDGPQNMIDALTVASLAGARGVLAVCSGVVHAAKNIQKIHPYRLDAFDSGESGPIGFVENGTVRMVNGWPEQVSPLPVSCLNTFLNTPWPRVEIVISCVGATGALVRAMCAEVDCQPVEGIVVAGTGNATIHYDLEKALELIEKDGVRVIRTSRCAYGSVVGQPRVEIANHLVVSVSAVKSRIDLMLELMVKKKVD